jgi:uncharacterized delta-60 repeat protein
VRAVALVAVIAVHALPVVHAQASSDPSWNGGAVTTIASSVRSFPSGQAVAPDGSMFVLMSYTGDPPYGDRIARIGADGQVDTTFGTGGIARPNTNSGSTVLSQSDGGIAFDPISGRVFVAAMGAGAGGWSVVSLTADGQPVNGWGTQGWADPLPSPGGPGTPRGSSSPQLAVDGAGRPIVAGPVSKFGPGPIDVTLVRLTTTGAVDPSFGTGGTTIVPTGQRPDNFQPIVRSVVIDGAGRIVVAGWSATGVAFVARLDPNGILDPTFGSGGVVMLDRTGSCVNDAATDALDRIVLLCQAPVSGIATPVLRRLDASGAVDRTFGADGVGAIPRRVTSNAVGRSLAITAQGEIVVGGALAEAPYFSPSGPAIWRFTPDGDLDLGEGDGGVERVGGLTGGDLTAVTSTPYGVSALLSLPDGYTGPGVGAVRLVTSGGTSQPSAVPLPSPQRILDTRTGLGAPAGQVPQGGVIALQVAGVAGVPATATAVALNLTVTEPAFAGFATVYSCDAGRPEASNLNWVAGATVPNLVIARLDHRGAVCIYTSAPAQIVADVTAYFPVDTDLRPLDAPVRRIDTRSTTLSPLGKIGGDLVARLSIVPVPGQTVLTNEAVLNVTVTEPDAAGFLTVYPCNQPRPTASNLNFVAGQTVANLVVVGASAAADACFFSNVPTHLVVDVQALVELGSGHRPIVPERLLDTRSGLGASAGRVGGTEVAVQVTGRAGIPSTARAVTINLTVTDPVAGGFATAYPCGGPVPSTSNVNFGAGETRANAVVVGTGSGGRVCLFSNVAADLVADVSEWFTPRGDI